MPDASVTKYGVWHVRQNIIDICRARDSEDKLYHEPPGLDHQLALYIEAAIKDGISKYLARRIT